MHYWDFHKTQRSHTNWFYIIFISKSFQLINNFLNVILWVYVWGVNEMHLFRAWSSYHWPLTPHSFIHKTIWRLAQPMRIQYCDAGVEVLCCSTVAHGSPGLSWTQRLFCSDFFFPKSLIATYILHMSNEENAISHISALDSGREVWFFANTTIFFTWKASRPY